MRSGPTQEREGDTCCPTWLGSGQNFPDLHLEQFSFEGTSTALRRRPYFRRGMGPVSWKGAKCLRHFLRDLRMSFREGVLSVFPFRPSSLAERTLRSVRPAV